jgi:hypothetical protein
MPIGGMQYFHCVWIILFEVKNAASLEQNKINNNSWLFYHLSKSDENHF